MNARRVLFLTSVYQGEGGREGSTSWGLVSPGVLSRGCGMTNGGSGKGGRERTRGRWGEEESGEKWMWG